jgi:hypothetical protein
MFAARAAAFVTRRPMRLHAPTHALHEAAPAPAAQTAPEPAEPSFAGWHLSSWELQSGVTVVELSAPEDARP